MIAMQYSFVLPADYDMAIIDKRIRDKGHLFDGFPHLRFKAFLSARRQGGDFPSTANLYAPFYLWDEPEGISDFLSGPGFAAVTQSFGWPEVTSGRCGTRSLPTRRWAKRNMRRAASLRPLPIPTSATGAHQPRLRRQPTSRTARSRRSPLLSRPAGPSSAFSSGEACRKSCQAMLRPMRSGMFRCRSRIDADVFLAACGRYTAIEWRERLCAR